MPRPIDDTFPSYDDVIRRDLEREPVTVRRGPIKLDPDGTLRKRFEKRETSSFTESRSWKQTLEGAA